MNTPLFIWLLLCHYICDYSHLSTPTMLSAKKVGYPLGPIFSHALVHTSVMALVLGLVFSIPVMTAVVILFIELCTHFLIDVGKGMIQTTFPQFGDSRTYAHWYLFGADQTLHILVLVLISYIGHA